MYCNTGSKYMVKIQLTQNMGTVIKPVIGPYQGSFENTLVELDYSSEVAARYGTTSFG
jgi:hypothetical protein